MRKRIPFTAAIVLSSLPAIGGLYCLSKEQSMLSVILLCISLVGFTVSIVVFVSYATFQVGAPLVLNGIQHILGPITRFLARTYIIGPVVSVVVRLTFFLWFMMLLMFDHLIRSILSRLVGVHPTGRRFSVINAMDPDFSLFAKPTVTNNIRHPYYSLPLAYTLSVASKLVYEDVAVIEYELEKAGFEVLETFKPIAYLNICAFIVAKGNDILLVFRGTNPLNFQNYVTNIHMGMIEIHTHLGESMGRVHKGFWQAMGDSQVNRTNRSAVAALQLELDGVSLYRTIVSAFKACFKILEFLTLNVFHHVSDPVDSSWIGHSTDIRTNSMFVQAEKHIVKLLEKRPPDSCLFITGHSLGGALATIFLAKMLQSKSKALDRFQGLYTYGHPKIGDATFARAFNSSISSKIFHHAYNNDIVPRVPSWLKYDTPPGTLVFIDSGYNITIYPSNPKTNIPVPVRAISFLHLSGLLNRHIIQRLPHENSIRILFRILLPFFLNDHFPSDYCDALRRHRSIKTGQAHVKKTR
ncbi:Alpha/Beta hydrolase protein [Dichotomocladium elegans]|nr:Alpha/Beta hydrolase protein [Dichotomocladium elegans]